MSIVDTVNVHGFRDAFAQCGRSDSFGYDALGHLFDYLEEMSEGGEPIELDPIACCCEYSEHGSAMEALEEYTSEEDRKSLYADCEDDDDREEVALEYFNERTGVVHSGDGCFLFTSF